MKKITKSYAKSDKNICMMIKKKNQIEFQGLLFNQGHKLTTAFLNYIK